MEHFNKLEPWEAELLAVLSEECGEVIQAIAKIQRHGFESHNPLIAGACSNRDALTKEMGDVRAAMIMLCDASVIHKETVHKQADAKLNNIKRWLHHN